MAEQTPEQIAQALSETHQQAIAGAFEHSDGSGFYLRSAVPMSVRRALLAKGLLSRRITNPLNKKGRQVREILLKNGRNDG